MVCSCRSTSVRCTMSIDSEHSRGGHQKRQRILNISSEFSCFFTRLSSEGLGSLPPTFVQD